MDYNSLLSTLEEMEQLNRSLCAVQIYYADINTDFEQTIIETKNSLVNATLDLAIDLDHKINHQIDKGGFVEQIIKNLRNALNKIQYFPEEKKLKNFNEIELQLSIMVDFAEQYSVGSRSLIENLNRDERLNLINKILNIKSRNIV